MSVESENIIALYERHADAWVQARLLESILYESPGWTASARFFQKPDRFSTVAAVQENRSRDI
jgi:hypothetical protein